MSKLISVEYYPTTNKSPASELSGQVGEMRKHEYISRVKSIKAAIKNVNRASVKVRFPLASKKGRISPGDITNYPDDDILFAAESISLPLGSLHVVDKMPVSYYERVFCTSEQAAKEAERLLGESRYLVVKSLPSLEKTIKNLESVFKFVWQWRTQNSLHGDNKPLFVEARIYGADTVVPLYKKGEFNGVAIEIISRKALTPVKKKKKGLCKRSSESDLFLMTNTKRYVGVVDGVSTKTKQISKQDLIKTPLKGYLTPKQLLEIRKSKLTKQ